MLLERLGNLLRSKEREAGGSQGLQAIHLQVLSFLSSCNKYSNTPAGITEYFGITKGTISQTLNVLEKNKLITRSADKKDLRVVHVELTKKAVDLLKNEIPPAVFKEALSELNDIERKTLTNLLYKLLVALQHNNNGKTFGVCKTCRHFKANAFGRHHQCGLTNEKLFNNEASKICREHERMVS